MSVQFKATIQTAGVLHTQLTVPFSPAAHRLHLPYLPASETPKVPTQIECLKKQDNFLNKTRIKHLFFLICILGIKFLIIEYLWKLAFLKPILIMFFFSSLSSTFLPGQKNRFEEVTLRLRTQTGLRSNKLLHVARQTLKVKMEVRIINPLLLLQIYGYQHFKEQPCVQRSVRTCTSKGSSAWASSVSSSSTVIVTIPLFWMNIA